MGPLGWVLLLSLVASACVWWWIAERWLAGVEVLPWEERDACLWSPPAFALAVMWVGVQAWLKLRAFAFPEGDAPGEARPEDPLLDLYTNALLLGALTAILLVSLSEFGRQPLAAFGVHARRWREQVRVGALGFLASLLPVYLVVLATLPLRSPERLHPLIRLVLDKPDLEIIAWVGLMVVVLAPLAEELLFRVVLQGTLTAWIGSGAVVLVAVVFSAIHGWPDALPLFPLALVMGYIYHRSRSFLAIVVTHALFNGWMLAIAAARALTGEAEP